MKLAHQSVLVAVVAVVIACMAFWWLFDEEPETAADPGTEGLASVLQKNLERPRVVGRLDVESMVRVSQSGERDEGMVPMSVEEKLRTLDEGVRAAPAPAGRVPSCPDASPPPSSTVVCRHRAECGDVMKEDEKEPLKLLTLSGGTSDRRRAREQGPSEPVFVPKVPKEFYAERLKWHPQLQELGVANWSYQVIQVSLHSYRVNAYFSFDDGRKFIYSATTVQNYPAAPSLVRDWLAKNSQEVID